MIRVFLAGEGKHELGGWANEAPYRDPTERGVLAALCGRVAGSAWEVAEARRWKDVHKFRAGDHRSPEERTVLGLGVLAVRAGCDVLVFSRDLDRLVGRREEIERALQQLKDVQVVGGVAVRTLDGWCLALSGLSGSEDLPRPKEILEGRECRTTEDRVALVDGADLARVAPDARSLHQWLARAIAALRPAS